MSTIEEALRTRLTADGTIIYKSAEVYPHEIYQGAIVPAITYQQISAVYAIAMDGEIPLCSTRFQVNCWDDTYEGAKDLAEAVRNRLNGYSGTASGVTIQMITVQDEGDLISLGVAAEESKRYGRWTDYKISYNAVLCEAPTISLAVVIGENTEITGTNFGTKASGSLVHFMRNGEWEDITSYAISGTWTDTTIKVWYQQIEDGEKIRIGNACGRVSTEYEYESPPP